MWDIQGALIVNASYPTDLNIHRARLFLFLIPVIFFMSRVDVIPKVLLFST